MSKLDEQRIEYGLILAAGRGTRLGDLTEELPKALVKIKEEMRVIDYILKGYAAAGLKKAVIIIGYQGEKIKDYLGDEAYGLEIIYIEQDLDNYGTAKAVEQAKALLENKFFIMTYGDIITEAENYKRLIKAGRDLGLKHSGMLLNWLKEIKKGGLVKFEADEEIFFEFNQDHRLQKKEKEVFKVKSIKEKPDQKGGGWNSAGIYLFSPEIFKWIAQVDPSDRGEYELPAAVNLLLEAGEKLYALKSRGYCQDVGTPADLDYLKKFLDN
ncbi:sugar phosphate nucleotidyltransferase [Halanaerobium sp. ST460_2HS_T2]|uniref:nucleotidyltransferase family protein n=1 Tax=Halanaerobium sp. ST460_2HS_T2 TaxID=2183914 RepID=UPI000DF19619|nr:sugar phosphate nucleotidyltransferase [Halanaerobium sp. ST460_2HS_T2]RCW52274.1 glucose-1-phosphate thymidylyltransferase [Halanaerobium sp. ST460_2HS_T2]